LRRPGRFSFRGTDPKFRVLNVQQQVVMLAVLTGPAANRIGLFVYGRAAVAERLNMDSAEFCGALDKVLDAFGWRFDPASSLLCIPTWWAWNHPENESVLRGNLNLKSVRSSTPRSRRRVETIPDVADGLDVGRAYVPP